MRWRGGRRSDNVIDKRGASPSRGSRRGFGLGSRRGRGVRLPIGRKGGIGGIGMLIAAMVVMWMLGMDPTALLTGGGLDGLGGMQSEQVGQPASQRSAAENELAEFVSVVLADTEDTWHALFNANDLRYEEPQLVLFTDAVDSACGFAQAAMGPFYCPGDQRIYIDLSFYRDLRDRYGAPGDFAQAYVVAHEVAHHVQTLLGISPEVQRLRQQVSKVEANQLSVRLELQADCFAGVWAHHADRTRQIIEPGDVEEALGAASAIGDDRLQKQAGRRVTPDSFTHGQCCPARALVHTRLGKRQRVRLRHLRHRQSLK